MNHLYTRFIEVINGLPIQDLPKLLDQEAMKIFLHSIGGAESFASWVHVSEYWRDYLSIVKKRLE